LDLYEIQQKKDRLSQLIVDTAIEKKYIVSTKQVKAGKEVMCLPNSIVYVETGLVGKQPFSNAPMDMFYIKRSIIDRTIHQEIEEHHDKYYTLTTSKIVTMDRNVLTHVSSVDLHMHEVLELKTQLLFQTARSRLLSLNVRKRIYYALYMIAKIQHAMGSERFLKLPSFLTHELLSRLTYTSRTRVSYVMSELKKKRILHDDPSGGLVIRRPGKLEQEHSLFINK
jgi:hypothetical protein